MKAVAMKRRNTHNLPKIPYPNAATKRELFNKFLDMALAGAVGAALAACLVFLLALG